MNDTSRTPSVAVVGGGITGMTAAIRLAEAGCRVTLYEKRQHLGGLSDSYRWHDVTWDRFYHVVLSSDSRLLALIDELGLGDTLFWKKTRSGFYGDGKLVSMSSMVDFFTFPFLSMWQKFRLGMGIVAATRMKDTAKLDRIYVKEWLTSVFGRRVYERVWDPLLRSKLGEARNETSAALIRATISRLYGARNGEAKSERMGHVRGGYAAILAAAERRLLELGVSIRSGSAVDAIRSEELAVVANGNAATFDRILLTVPAPEVLHMIGNEATATRPTENYWYKLSQVSYLGVICVLLVLERGLSPFYVTNLLDKTLPFTGIIEVTNVIEPETFGGKHLVYLPKYVTQDDPAIMDSDDVIAERFIAALKRVHPALGDTEILHRAVFREPYVQPLQEVNFLEKQVGFSTPIPGLYLANTTMLYNATLNNNAAITLAEQAAKEMSHGVTQQPSHGYSPSHR